MALCKFFAQGFCRHGASCTFIHEPGTNTGQLLAPVAPALPTTKKLNLNPAATTYLNDEAKPAQTCHFFLQGKCNKGKECRYTHLPAILSPQQVRADPTYLDSPQLPPDYRATVPCRFLSRPSGCQNSSCPYLHVADGPSAEKRSSQDLEANREEVSSRFSNSCRSQG